MPISIKTDLEFGDTFYLKDDPFQQEHSLIAVVFCPGKTVKFRLSLCGEIMEVYDFEASKDRDEAKALKAKEEE